MSIPPSDQLPAQDWLLWPGTQRVMALLTADGGAARFVGGAVRDGLLRRPVKDVDVATPLRPEEVMARLAPAGVKVIPTGIKHGTVTAIADHRHFEITTLRHDVETFGRHAHVAFTDDWKGDAARRDFTMNALYADDEGRIYDYFGGAADARAGRVRFIGEACARIAEDALRILRFFRFHASHGRGAPDAEGLAACIEARMSMQGLSRERVRDELMKLLITPDPAPTFALMLEHGILEGVVPEERDLAALRRLVAVERAAQEEDALRRVVALLPRAPQVVSAVLRRLKFSNREIKRGALMVEAMPAVHPKLAPREARAALYRLGGEAFTDRLLLACGVKDDPAPLLALARDWQKPVLPVTGGDLARGGLGQGPEVGRKLKALEEAWIASDFTLGRDELLKLAHKRA
ncbi:MAG: CCA tRNA nucleotidyltransferase [Pseudomonadota bacterium]